MVRILGHWVCAAEYLDHCLERKRVVDVVQLKGVSYYVFEDGHKLPLLCFCCGDPLDMVDPKRGRKNIVGRRLEGMSLAIVTMDDGRELEQFRLEFSKKGVFSKAVYTPVSPLVATGMRHPSDCPHAPGVGKGKSRPKPRS
jgi:hypothetical protein